MAHTSIQPTTEKYSLKMKSCSVCCLKLSYPIICAQNLCFCDGGAPSWPFCCYCAVLLLLHYGLGSGGSKQWVCLHVLQLVASLCFLMLIIFNFEIDWGLDSWKYSWKNSVFPLTFLNVHILKSHRQLSNPRILYNTTSYKPYLNCINCSSSTFVLWAMTI